MHGGQRLVVFEGGRYLGQSALNVPPLTRIRVSGTAVLLDSAENGPVRLDFSREPPRRILVNGETEDFFR